MRFNQNTFVLILLITGSTLTLVGCKGAGSASSPVNLLAKRADARAAQSVEGSATRDSRPAGVAFANTNEKANDKGSSSKVALASYVSPGKNNNQAEWLKSYDEAISLSKQTGRPILADFTGSNWCGYCIKLKKEILDTPKFKNWAAENVVLLELDFPRPDMQPEWIKKQNNQLRKRYDIQSYPTVLILNSEGHMIGSQGYMRGGPERWISVANNTVQANRTLKKAKLVDVADFRNSQ